MFVWLIPSQLDDSLKIYLISSSSIVSMCLYDFFEFFLTEFGLLEVERWYDKEFVRFRVRFLHNLNKKVIIKLDEI
jgi:hypothetical protein